MAGTNLNVDDRSIAEIKAFVKNNPAPMETPTTYDIMPSFSSPYVLGKLSTPTRTAAFNMLNQMRYIAGLPANVVNDTALEELAQAAALVNAANNVLSHYPEQPSDMDNSLFALGELGAGSSNIGWGIPVRPLPRNIVHGWMKDSTGSNLASVGHRRWILNPAMKKSGFGAAGNYTANYVFDFSGSAAAAGYNQVSWPAQNMPIEYWANDFPWSISMGSNVNMATAQVTLTRVSDNQTWIFSSGSADATAGYFNVNNQNYGQTGCIIFRPATIAYKADDIFNVSITGVSTPVSYTVKFFELFGPNSLSLSTNNLALNVGDTSTMSFTVSPADAVITNVTCLSSDSTVATVQRTGTNLTVNAISAGTATITIVSADGTVSDTCTVTVSSAPKGNQILSGSNSYSKVYGDSNFSLDTLLTVGDGTLTYSSSNNSVATVSASGLVSITGVGTANITISSSETATYYAATKTVTVTVASAPKGNQILSGSNSYSKVYGDNNFSLDTLLTVGDGTLTYSSSNNSVTTVSSSGLVSITGVGTTNITISSSETATYYAATKTVTITVASASSSKGNQTLSGPNSYSKTYGDSNFALNTRRTVGDGALTYASSNSRVATVSSNGNVAITGSGQAIITVTATETAAYKQTTKRVVITVAKANQTFTGTTHYTRASGNKRFSLNTKLATGNGKLTYASSAKNIAAVSANGQITIKNSGQAIITIKAAGTTNYNTATTSVVITVKPGKAKVASVKSPSRKRLTVKWNRIAAIDGYQLQYSTNKNFKKGSATKTSTITKARTTTRKYSGLKSRKKYYVRIRAYKTISGKRVYGAWSSRKSIRVK